LAVKSLWEAREAPHEYLERLGLADARSFRDMFVRKIVCGQSLVFWLYLALFGVI
jgi:hypothetical protein